VVCCIFDACDYITDTAFDHVVLADSDSVVDNVEVVDGIEPDRIFGRFKVINQKLEIRHVHRPQQKLHVDQLYHFDQ
jgi:hypothetical protein